MVEFKKKKKQKDNLEYEMKIWEKTIEVQMHFNELQMKIRNFSVLLVSALVGAAGIGLKEHIMVDHSFFGFHLQTSLSAILFAVAAISWLAFFFMDQYWYYPLLIGSVNHGGKVEKSLMARVPSIGLTKTIGDASPKTFLGMKLHSKHKSYIFYLLVFFLLVALAIATGWAPTVSPTDPHADAAASSLHSSDSGGFRPATTANQLSTVTPQATGTTIIFNQELSNGQPGSQAGGAHRIKTTVGHVNNTVDHCASQPRAATQ